MHIEKSAVKVGSRHGSVIPVLAENPNHPEEQSAVVNCGQSLKTHISSRVLTGTPITKRAKPATTPAGSQTDMSRHTGAKE